MVNKRSGTRVALTAYMALTAMGWAALAAACSLPAVAAPAGIAEVRAFHQVPEAVPPEYDVTVLVTNTGDLTINASHVTVSLASTEREYVESVHETVGVVPGGALAMKLTVVFLEEDESLAEGSQPTVVSAYFE